MILYVRPKVVDGNNMGMVTQLGKFTPNLAQLSQPLRDLLSSKSSSNWEPSQREAFLLVKMESSKPSVLAHYSPTARVKVTADASSYGLGCCVNTVEQGRVATGSICIQVNE